MAKFEPRPFGKYFLTNRIAMGGMAEIYKAKTFGVDGFEKTLAIKKILPHYSQDKNFVTMLTDEAKLVVNLSHPNIVQVYDLGRVGGDYFISMEYINGVNLRELIGRAEERDEKIPLPLGLYIIAEVCKGLDYAHAKRGPDGNPLSIVHRDVSPHNVLVSFEGEVKLVDFGIAKAVMNVSQTHFGTLKGKVMYMSPEQALGKPIDHRTDIFSLGLVLYELVTGKRLFVGESQLEVLEKIRKTKITGESLGRDVPLPVLQILARALAYSPHDRYQTAADFQAALTKCLFIEFPDFTPRRLAELLTQWFGLTDKLEASLSQPTPSRLAGLILEDPESQVMLVHRDDAQIEMETLRAGEVHPDDFLKTQNLSLSSHRVSMDEATEKSVIPGRVGWGGGHLWLLVMALVMVLVVVGVLVGKDKDKPQIKSVAAEKTASSFYSTTVVSHPPGAMIFLDGKDTGLLTPAEIPQLKVGRIYHLRLVRSSFEDYFYEMVVDEARDQVLDVNLSDEPVSRLSVTSVPLGAEIFLNGHSTGFVTPHDFMDLAVAQKLVVTLHLEGYKEDNQVITVDKAGDLGDMHFALERIIRTFDLTLTSNVEGAEVLLNGREYGVTPVVTRLPEGKYTVILRREGYREAIQTFVIRDGSKDLHIMLEKSKNEETL